MSEKNRNPGLSAEALENKSKAYIKRALKCKEQDDLDQYQLWASLALELLGKAALSSIHPSLIADPMHWQSLFVASGISVSTNIRTITAKTLFIRLAHLSKTFDENVKNFCIEISQRRNMELHSGSTPFQAMKLEAWERQYWHAAKLILQMHKASLDEWLEADQIQAPREIIRYAEEATASAVQVEIRNKRENFGKLKKQLREHIIASTKDKNVHEYVGNFSSLKPDETWKVRCPACDENAIMAGMQYEETAIEGPFYSGDGDGYGHPFELVERTYAGEELLCPVCGLSLQNQAEISAAGLDIEYKEEVEQGIEYEPDYGNE